MRFCEAVTSSSSYGYWIFPPLTIRLLWDGEQIFWSYGDNDDWLPLSSTDSGAVQYPGFSDTFDTLAPDYLGGYSPPLISSLLEPGNFQLWSGLLAKTRPGWSLNIRAPVNVPRIPTLDTWEGIVETDIWLGPLFGNFRITKTDTPVVLRANTPFLQVQAVPQMAYSNEILESFECREAESLAHDDWSRLSKVLLPNPDWEARKGEYSVTVRKRRLCPVNPASLLNPDN